MLPLRDLQAAFVAAVLENDDNRIANAVRDGRFDGGRLVRIYRNNSFTSLTRALEAVYPVAARLVGDGFFSYAADCYIRRYPSTSGNLHDFGDRLAVFLETFEPVAALPYLPDVARLEWAWHRVFHAAGHPPIPVDRLAAVPAALHNDLVFALHPASCLLVSDYPVLRIWEANQPGVEEQQIDLAEGGVRLLVWRRDIQVEINTLGAGEFQLLRSCADGRRFTEACAAALAADPGLDLPGTLQRHVRLGTIASFGLHPAPATDLPSRGTPA